MTVRKVPDLFVNSLPDEVDRSRSAAPLTARSPSCSSGRSNFTKPPEKTESDTSTQHERRSRSCCLRYPMRGATGTVSRIIPLLRLLPWISQMTCVARTPRITRTLTRTTHTVTYTHPLQKKKSLRGLELTSRLSCICLPGLGLLLVSDQRSGPAGILPERAPGRQEAASSHARAHRKQIDTHTYTTKY